MINLSINFISKDVNGIFTARSDIARYTMYGIPRNLVQEAINELPDGLQGIYFLVNKDESKNVKRYLYIGQTKQEPTRLIDHKNKKPEWNMAYMFLADKKDLDLQTTDELEAYEISRFFDSNKYNLINSRPNKASCSSLTQLFSESIEEVLSFFGYDPFLQNESKEIQDNDIFIMNRNGAKGLLKIKNGKYILLNGSYISQSYNEQQISDKSIKLRENLLKTNNLIKEGIYYKTQKDIIFDTPSAASVFVIGMSDNGWTSFKNKDGKTLKDLKNK